MRCPTCGTENAPDSRFCGGCGARLDPTGHASQVSAAPRLAPTAKIPDDAPYPQGNVASRAPSSVPPGPVSYAPPSLPPPAAAPMSTPPPGSLVRPASQQPSPATSGRAPSSAAVSAAPTNNNTRARPQLSGASESFAVPPRRPVGLIALVLVVDLGLAAAGAVLLAKGLSKPDAKTEKPVEKKTQLEPAAPPPSTAASVVPAAAPAPAPDPAPAAPPAPPAATGSAPAAARDTRAPQRDDKPTKKGTAATAATSGSGPVTSPSAQPVTSVPTTVVPPAPAPAPVAVPSPADEIDAKIAKAKSVFAHCGEQFPAKGTVQIALQVRADGKVINVAAVENSTGNPQLAQCIGVEIASWTVSPHSGDPVNLFRPFTYP